MYLRIYVLQSTYTIIYIPSSTNYYNKETFNAWGLKIIKYCPGDDFCESYDPRHRLDIRILIAKSLKQIACETLYYTYTWYIYDIISTHYLFYVYCI